MSSLIRVELLKLRTTRAAYGMLATAAALCALFSSLEALGAGSKDVAPLSTAAGLSVVVTGGVGVLIMSAIMGVTISSGEFRHATATLTYLAEPRRGRVLAAKLVTGVLAGAVIGAVGYLVTIGVALIFVAAHGDQVAIGAGTLAGYGAGHVLAGALIAAVGVALGSLIRSQLAAAIGIFAWMIVIESVLGGVYPATRPYLPYTAAATLTGSKLGGAAFGPAHGVAGGSPLPFAAAAALVAGVAAVIALAAARTTVRADVS
jgi:ABC-2 type transport system permease protein